MVEASEVNIDVSSHGFSAGMGSTLMRGVTVSFL
jgi:hypothetical protein